MAAGTEITGDLKKPVEILCLPCVKLVDHPLHIGFYMESHLEGLVASVRESGLLEPVVVCPAGNDEYRILSGHYRVRAVRRLKWKTVACRVVMCDRRTSAVIYCTSNLLSRGLSAIEEGYMISHLISEEKFTLAEIGRLWGKSKSWASRRMALLVHLEPSLKKELGSGHLSPRTAQELLRLPRGNEQGRVLAIIRKCHLNKDEAAQLVDYWLNADEEGKRSLEKSGFPKRSLVSERVSGAGEAWIKTAEIHFLNCTQVLTQITGLVENQVQISYWPMKVYQSFFNAVVSLDKLIEMRFHRRES